MHYLRGFRMGANNTASHQYDDMDREELLLQLQLRDKKVENLEGKVSNFKEEIQKDAEAVTGQLLPKLDRLKQREGTAKLSSKARADKIAASQERKHQREAVTDEHIQAKMRNVPTSSGVSELAHTLASARIDLKRKGCRWRVIEVRASNSPFSHAVNLFTEPRVLRGINVEVAPYCENIDWDSTGGICFPNEVKEAATWRCLLYEGADGAEVFWVPPRVLKIGDRVIRGEACLRLAELGENGRVVASEPIDMLSRALSELVSIQDEYGKPIEAIYAKHSELGLRVDRDLVHQQLHDMCYMKGLFNWDILYNDVYEGKGLPGGGPFDFQLLFEGEAALDGSISLDGGDPRLIWVELAELIRKLEEEIDSANQRGLQATELLWRASEAATFLDLYQSSRAEAQELAWVAYCAGMRRAEIAYDLNKRELANLGKKFKTRSVNPDGRFPHTRVIRRYIREYHKLHARWPSPDKLVKYIENQIDTDKRVSQDLRGEVKERLKNRNVAKKAIEKEKHR
ncbi:hypothetical protein ACFSQZ_01410 [Rubritalea spongiae]|uniref:Uncharacterized protein n=2 Tax=Rubritalea spongiae TaxID=430797 RepID=A0ABW5DZT3_9BACT